MQKIGLLLITIGFLGGCMVAVMDQKQVDWTYFGPAFAVGILGVVLVQIGRRRAATHVETLSSNIEELKSSLAKIVENITALDSSKHEADVYDLPKSIDEKFPADITRFVDARESMIHVFGVQTYADIMSDFAAGERYLNRVWSAAAEGYIDEAHTYLGRSREQFDHAQSKLQAANKA